MRQKHLSEGGALQSSGTVPHSGEARQEPEAAGHVAATVRKYREMNARAPPTFSFYSVQDANTLYGAAHNYGGSSHLN